MKLEINGKSMKKGIMTGAFILLIAAVIAQFGIIVYMNYAYAKGMLDYDSSLAIRHCMEMWKNRKINLPYFGYGSSMELDCASFFAAPIYLLTNNLGLAMASAHAVLYLMTVAIIFGLCRNLRTGRHVPFIVTLVVFSPYASGMLDWSNMIFISTGQYEFRIMLILLMLDVLFWDDEKRNRKYFWVLTAASFAFVFWIAVSCGNYVLLMIILPFLLWNGLDWALKRREKLFTRPLVLLIAYTVISAAGYLVHNAFTQVTHRNNLPFIEAKDFFDNIKNCLTGSFLLLGGLPTSPSPGLISYTGISQLARFVFFIACVVFVIYRLRLVGKETLQTDRKIPMIRFAAVYAGFSLVILMITDSTYGSPIFEYRYHILWVYLLLVTASIFLFTPNHKIPKRMLNLLRVGFFCCLVWINITGWLQINKNYDTTYVGTEEMVLQFADQFDADTIYYLDNPSEAHRIRAMEPDKYCVSIAMNQGEVAMFDCFDNYDFYSDASLGGQKNILSCLQKDFDKLPEWRKEPYTLLGTIQNYGIYYSPVNMWDCFSGPPLFFMKKTEDYPTTLGYRYEGTLKKDGLVYTDPEFEGYVLESPYMYCEGGTYDITLSYETVSGEAEGMIEVFWGEGGEKIADAPLQSGISEVVLKDVKVKKTELLKILVSKKAGSGIVLRSICYTKKK